MSKPEFNVFVSRSLHDKDLADYLIRDLQAQGVHVWSDKDIMPGTDLVSEIQTALERARVYVMLLSPQFLESRWANFELGVAVSRAQRGAGVRVVPVLAHRLRQDELPPPLRELQAIDMEGVGLAEASRQIAEIVRQEVGEDAGAYNAQ